MFNSTNLNTLQSVGLLALIFLVMWLIQWILRYNKYKKKTGKMDKAFISQHSFFLPNYHRSIFIHYTMIWDILLCTLFLILNKPAAQAAGADPSQ